MALVHRDVSPHNILLGFDGVVRLTDFGIAKALGRSTHTESGVLKGKLSYMSPEQLRFLEPDRRSDIFSLGIILYELVLGEHPFGASPKERAANIVAGVTPDIGEDHPVPAELVELLYEMLAVDRELRPDGADGVRRRLELMVADLAANDGPTELCEYMAAMFGDHLVASRRQLRRARNQRQEVGTGGSRAAPESGGPRSSHAWVALVALLSMVAGAVSIGFILPPQPSTSRSRGHEEVGSESRGDTPAEEIPGQPTEAHPPTAETVRPPAEETPEDLVAQRPEGRVRRSTIRARSRATRRRRPRVTRPNLMGWNGGRE